MLMLDSGPVPMLLPDQCYTTRCEYVRDWFQQAYMERRKESAWIRTHERRRIVSGPAIPLAPAFEALTLDAATELELLDLAFKYIYAKHPQRKAGSVIVSFGKARDSFVIKFSSGLLTSDEFESLSFYRVNEARDYLTAATPRKHILTIERQIGHMTQMDLFTLAGVEVESK